MAPTTAVITKMAGTSYRLSSTPPRAVFKFSITQIYTDMARSMIESVQSPLDNLE
ncbi:hypothetical protein ACFL3S_11680 [Gemmatimonadota bacterium]